MTLALYDFLGYPCRNITDIDRFRSYSDRMLGYLAGIFQCKIHADVKSLVQRLAVLHLEF